MKWILLLLGVLANGSASILVKLAVTPPRRLPSLRDPLTWLANGPLWLGLVMFGAAFVFYAAALTRLPLNVAHPVLTSGAVALVALVSAFVLREPFHWTTVAGIVLVIAGVVLITARVG
jgi:multidrug transporter EmrE-like cation transporter